MFEPQDSTKPKDTWNLEVMGENDRFFIRNGDKSKLYAPPDVENYFGLYLLGERCGMPKSKPPAEPTTEDGGIF